MAYDAFTIDTNMAIQGGLNLEAGLLGQLTQFRHGQIELVLSEIVVREIRRHLVQQVRKVRDTLISSAHRAEEVQLTQGDGAAELKKAAEALSEPREVAGTRLTRYIASTGAHVVPIALTSIEDLVRSYFSAIPPFDPTGAKKSEFPDAIALLSLENWARSTGKKVLAVTQDGGWAKFAKSSEHIDVEPDFARALQIVQEHAEEARARIARILSAVGSGALPSLADAIEDGLRNAMPLWPLHGEGGGSFHLELDVAELEYGSHQLTRDDNGYDITVVRMGSSQIVARIGAQFSAIARAEFSLSVWDGIDREYVGMGSETAEQEVEFDGAFLMTLTGEFSGQADDELELDETEIVEALGYFDFGEIEFQPDPADYEDWTADDVEGDGAEQASEASAPDVGQAF